jgi:hypothetical protein
VYTVLLVLSLLALLIGCALLYAVVNRYDGQLAPSAQALPGAGAASVHNIDVQTADSSECHFSVRAC